MAITRRTLLAELMLGAGWLATSQAFAQSVTWIMVPYTAGGPADITARKVAPLLQKGLGGSVLVDNLGGAGGLIGVQKALAAPPDGHMMVLGTVTDSVLSPLIYKDAKYKAEDLRMVGFLSSNPLVLLAKPDAPFNDVKTLISKSHEGRGLFYGSLGPGSIFHLVSEDLAQRTNAKLTQVPYKGLAPVVQDLMAGQIDVAFYPLAGNVFDLIKAGKVKAIGITGNAREPKLPNVSTFNETGLTQGFDHTMWPALFMSAKVSQAEAERVNAIVRSLVKAPEFVKFCEETGTTPAPPMSLEETAAFYRGEMATFRKLASKVGLQQI